MHRLLCLIGCLGCICSAQAAATSPLRVESDESRADSLRLHHIEDVTVTARRTQQMVTQQQLRGGDLQALSTTSVADAMRYFAGAQIRDYGGMGGMKTLNVRSLGAQHVGVYIDGVRLSNAQNGTVDLGKYSLSTLESVSLYNGHQQAPCQSASEYASGATVYLTTRRPTADSLSLQARHASFGTWMGKVNAQKVMGRWSAFIDGEVASSEGDYPFRYHSQYEDTTGRRANSDIRYYRLEGGVMRGGFTTHIYYYDSQRGCPGGIVRRLSDKYVNVGREWDRDFFVQASYQHRWQHHMLRSSAKYSYEYLRYCTDYPENQNTARVDNHYRTHDGYGALSYAWLPTRWLTLSTGYDLRYTLLCADLKRFTPVHRLDQKAVMALNADWHGLQAAASLLYQRYSDHTAAHIGAADPLTRFTPSLSLAYSRYGVTLRAWYKKIFRAPTLNDLYYTQVGNRNLRPEYTRQVNVGVEHHYDGRRWHTQAQADFYQNRIDDRIVCLPLKGTYTWTMMNYGYTFCRGLNAAASVRYSHGPWLASLHGTLTLQRDLNRTDPDDPDTYDQPICYSPTLSWTGTAIAGWRWVQLTVGYQYVGERMWSYADPADQLPAYQNIDLKADVRWRHYAMTLEVNDLLDEQYEHLPRYPMPGRSFRLTLGVNF